MSTHDNGPLGSAAIDRAEERRIELLKANGYNAIRCSHNPPSTVFLDACDRLGMMIIDESFDMWQKGKNPDDYHLDFKDWWKKDIDSMVLRDRNHPSVIMWSIGNEISERSDPDGVEIARNLSGRVRELDTTRPVTMAVPFFFDAKASTALERHRCRLPIPRCLWLQLYEGSLRILTISYTPHGS